MDNTSENKQGFWEYLKNQSNPQKLRIFSSLLDYFPTGIDDVAAASLVAGAGLWEATELYLKNDKRGALTEIFSSAIQAGVLLTPTEYLSFIPMVFAPQNKNTPLWQSAYDNNVATLTRKFAQPLIQQWVDKILPVSEAPTPNPKNMTIDMTPNK